LRLPALPRKIGDGGGGMLRAVNGAAALGLVVLMPAAGVGAQTSATDAQDLRALTLTMDRVKQVDRAMDAIAKSLEGDEAFQAKMKRREAIESGEAEPTAEEEAQMMREQEDESSVGGAIRELEREPALVAAIRSVGLTTREFVLTQTALFQASFAHGAHKAGHLKEIPEEIPPEHVAFVAQHEQELAAMWKRWQEIGERVK
jgi:hypothetical protein